MLNTEKVTKPTQEYVRVSPVRRHHHRHNVKSRYEFIKTLGKGTYGKVKLARHKETQKLVAVKAIKKDRIKDSTDMKHIRREMEIMSSIQHPHIIQIYEVFENQDKIVIVMEYATGGELYDYLASKRGIPDGEAQFLFRQIVSAVQYCHSRGIVHRDLKLENILLNEDHQIKIADFGLANSFKSDSLLQTFCGSPLYASPEIVCGVPYRGPEVDSWSLGVLLYALVYGTMPFDGRNFQILTKQITSGVFCKPTKHSDAYDLIRWMLTVDPKNRASIEDIAHHKWVNTGAEPLPVFSPPPVDGDAAGYDQYLNTLVEADDNCQDQLDSTLKACEEEEEATPSIQPKGILKRKTANLSAGKPTETTSLVKKPPPDNTLAGQLAAVCGLQAKDSLKLKLKPQGVSGKRRVLRSKRDRESGYYSSPERVPPTNEKINQSDPALHTGVPPCIPQIKSCLANPGRLSRLHNKHSGTNSSLPPKIPAPFLGSKDCYLMPVAPGPDERLPSVSSDDSSSIGALSRPASTYSDSSILSSDSFDICTFDGTLVHLNGCGSPTAVPHSAPPLCLSLVQDTLPPLNDAIIEEQAPGSLTPKSEKLVRDLQRILAPSGRRNHARTERLNRNDATKRPQSLDENSQLTTMMDQLNIDLDLAYKKAIDICATLKSEV